MNAFPIPCPNYRKISPSPFNEDFVVKWILKKRLWKTLKEFYSWKCSNFIWLIWIWLQNDLRLLKLGYKPLISKIVDGYFFYFLLWLSFTVFTFHFSPHRFLNFKQRTKHLIYVSVLPIPKLTFCTWKSRTNAKCRFTIDTVIPYPCYLRI